MPASHPSFRQVLSLGLAALLVGLTGCSTPPAKPSAAATGAKSGVQTKFTSAAANLYVERLSDTVRQDWFHIMEESRLAPPPGASVVIEFSLNSRGEVDILKVEDTNAGKNAALACLAALQASQPHPKWPDDMIAELGNEQKLTFAFYFQ